MNTKTAASSATPTTPTPSSPADAEPSNADLASLLNLGGSKPAAKAKKPAAPAAEDDDPADDAGEDPDAGADDFADEPENTDSPAAEATDETPAEETDEPAEDADPAAEAENPDEPAAVAEDAPEGLDAEDLAARKKFTPAQQKTFDKALFKQRERHRQEIENLQAELNDAKANPPAPLAPTPDNPLADVATEADLDKRLAEQRNLRRWALTHPNGGTINGPDGKPIEITAERSAEIIADTDEMLRDHIPARREAIRQNAKLEQQAIQDYPWLKTKTSRGYVAVENMLRGYGHMRLRDIPGIRGDLADLFIGSMIRAQGKAQKQPAGKQAGQPAGAAAPKAPATPAGQRPPPKVAGAIKKTAGATKKLEDTGDDPDNAALGSLISRKR